MSAKSSTKQEKLQTSAESKKYRVMIVDDEQDITSIFKIGLERAEFVVTSFNDPLEALKNFRPALYDLLLLDIRMPGMNGFELYQKMKNIDSEVKVCFLTAFDEYREDFKAVFPALDEVKCYLKKPITVQDLITRLLELANS
ncbi:MAG TPA: response regulator [Nitrososphaera sp.]|nr:response regulator [Nitrososphaera sp.]